MTEFQDALLTWFDRERRDLPWRRTNDPYAIWISEAMLQQTTVAAVVPYYERWMARFPTVQSLASASEEDVLSLWQGLGYYRRARNLRAAAQAMSSIPSDHAGWREVVGVGPYTAAAVASIAYGEAVPLVDGNVERVYARLAADRSAGAARTRAAWKWAAENLERTRPGDWNQALMELGATVCRPKSPDCPRCPVQDWCEARKRGIQNELPTWTPKPKSKEHEWRLVIPVWNGLLGIQQIPQGEWWEGMWSFPTTAGDLPGDLEAAEQLGTMRAAVTTNRILIRVALARLAAPVHGLTFVTREEFERLPVPAPQRKALALAGLFL